MALIQEGGYRSPYRPAYNTQPTAPLGAPNPFYQPFDVTPYLSDPGAAPARPAIQPGQDFNQIVPRLIDWRVQQRAWEGSKQKANLDNQAVYKGVGSGGVNAYGWRGNTGVAQTKGSAPYGFQTQMWRALQSANAAMKKELGKGFSISDGWRSYQAQVDLKRRKPNLAATPGRSIHGLGLAADINLNSKQKRWLFENGAKFGIYAPMKSKEPWHWQLIPSRWGGWS